MGDYASAIQIIENLPAVSEHIKATYQQVSLKYGMQLYNNNQADAAMMVLEKSKSTISAN